VFTIEAMQTTVNAAHLKLYLLCAKDQ